MRRKIIPFWFPNRGCANRCIYCDQSLTMGNAIEMPGLQETEQRVLQAREELRRGGGEQPLEAAFFGGTFTALPLSMQEGYLSLAARLVEEGVLDSVRLSTHPLHVDRETVARLASFGVSAVELGVQSFRSSVLKTAGRGYLGRQAIDACQRVKEAGIELVIQLMPFLPSAVEEDDLHSALVTAELRPAAVRVFPTVVLKGTTLEQWFAQGRYEPATTRQAAIRISRMLEILLRKPIEVMRIGLQVSELTDSAVVAGPYHPAMGELCWGFLLARVLAGLICRRTGPEAPISLRDRARREQRGLRQGGRMSHSESYGEDEQRSFRGQPRSDVHGGPSGDGSQTVRRSKMDISIHPGLASFLSGHGRQGETRLAELCGAGAFSLAVGRGPDPPKGAIAWRCDRFRIRMYNDQVVIEKEKSQ